MKNCAVICEYNPFHTGHKYQLDTLRSLSVDNIFCVMSGDFVQSAMPAFCDKAIRAECAIRGGADAVIELPTVYATAGAQYFAEGAVKIISDIKDVTNIAMGGVGNQDDILRLAELKIKHGQRFSNLLKTNLDSGKSYNSASVAALCSLYGEYYPSNDGIAELLTDPNNILCIEYISAIDKLCPKIQPVIIQRQGATHTNTAESGLYVSATAIRNAENNGELDKMQRYIPFLFDAIKEQRQNHMPNIRQYKSMAVFALKCAEPNDIARLRNCSEGMEYLLKNTSRLYDFDEYIEATIGKRYGKKRLYRLFFDILLSIDKSLLDMPFCTRLLACKNGFDFTLLPGCVKTTNAAIKQIASSNPQINKVLDVDKKAVSLFNLISSKNGDYFNYSLVKV